MLGRDATEGLPQVVLTFCFTGAGSAHTLARMVREALGSSAHRVEVIPAQIGTGEGWNRLVATLLRSHRLLAAVGPFHPRIPGIPYISTEEMVVGQGTRRLRQLVDEGSAPPPAPVLAVVDQASIFAHMAASLGEHLKLTNPATTVPAALKTLTAVEQYLGRTLDDELRVGLVMHLVCMLERKVRERLFGASATVSVDYHGSLPWLPGALRELTGIFNIEVDAEELGRLDEIINSSTAVEK
jgi:transcriptional regulatory protein LevR